MCLVHCPSSLLSTPVGPERQVGGPGWEIKGARGQGQALRRVLGWVERTHAAIAQRHGIERTGLGVIIVPSLRRNDLHKLCCLAYPFVRHAQARATVDVEIDRGRFWIGKGTDRVVGGI